MGYSRGEARESERGFLKDLSSTTNHRACRSAWIKSRKTRTFRAIVGKCEARNCGVSLAKGNWGGSLVNDDENKLTEFHGAIQAGNRRYFLIWQLHYIYLFSISLRIPILNSWLNSLTQMRLFFACQEHHDQAQYSVLFRNLLDFFISIHGVQCVIELYSRIRL
jgi:hypothetical protein